MTPRRRGLALRSLRIALVVVVAAVCLPGTPVSLADDVIEPVLGTDQPAAPPAPTAPSAPTAATAAAPLPAEAPAPPASEPAPAEPSPEDALPAEPPPANSLPAEPLPADSPPAQPGPADSLPGEPLPAQPPTAAPLPAASPPAQPAPGASLPAPPVAVVPLAAAAPVAVVTLVDQLSAGSVHAVKLRISANSGAAQADSDPPRTHTLEGFDAACRDQPQSRACKHFLAPASCSPSNPFDYYDVGGCGFVLRVNPCWEDPASTLCQAFLEQPCFATPDGPACLAVVGTKVPGCEIDQSAITGPEACRLNVAEFLDFCETRPEFCDSPFGGTQEQLAFVGPASSGPDDESPPESGDSPQESGDYLGAQTKNVAVGVRGNAARSSGLSATGLDLVQVVLAGLLLLGLGAALRLRPRATVVLVILGGGLAGAASAHAYELNPEAMRWPFDRITYAVDDDGVHGTKVERAVVTGVEAWERAHVGWRFDRVRVADADVLLDTDFLTGPEFGDGDLRDVRRRPCIGRAVQGYTFAPSTVVFAGFCTQEYLRLGAAHEVGHLLGLEDTNEHCAVMNVGFVGRGNRARPAACPAGTGYLSTPVRRDDRRGAHRVHARRFSYPPRLCDPPDERPVLAILEFCRYAYDCRGATGENHVRESGPFAIFRFIDALDDKCRRGLRVRELPAPAGPGTPVGSTDHAQPVQLSRRGDYLVGFRIKVVLTCSDGTSQAPLPDDIGPFPRIRVGPDGTFSKVFESPNEVYLYRLRGSVQGGTVSGTFQAFESRDSTDLMPDPDGGLVCDSGSVKFRVEV